MDMSANNTLEMVLYATGSLLCFIGGSYLLFIMIEILQDYLRVRKLIHRLNRIERKVDQLPGVKKVDKGLEDRWYWSIK